MTGQIRRTFDVPEDAQARVFELARVFRVILAALDQQISLIGAADSVLPTTLIARLKELNAAHITVSAAEEALHGPTPKSDVVDEINLAQLRLEIGGQFDRLRAGHCAEAVSGGADICPTCGAALSV